MSSESNQIQTEIADDEEEDGEFDGKLLHQSCLWDNSDLLSDLLFGDESRNINSQDSKGRTALHSAVISNSLSCARLLLMNGADPNIRQFGDASANVSGKNCLHIAAERGQEEMVQILLEFNANIYSKDTNGLTAMDLAEQRHQDKVVDTLKSALVIKEKMRIDLYECLVIAVHKGEVESVKQLLGKAETDQSATTSLVNYAPNGSNTLLFKACQEGHLETVQLLIEAGSDGRTHPVTKYSPLYIAAYHGRLPICELLLKHFPELVSIFTVEHWLPVHAAAINNHQDIVKLLLSYEYPNKVMQPFLCLCDPLSVSPFSPQQSNANLSSIEQKQQQFGKPPASQPSGHHLKADHHSKDTASKQYIYLMPFDVNAQDIAGQSLLYLTTLLGNQSLVEFLLNFRSRAISLADYADYCGKDVKEIASAQNNFDLTDNQNQSELDYIFFGEDEIVSPDTEDVSSSSSSQDVTVISPISSTFDRKQSSTSQAEESRRFFPDTANSTPERTTTPNRSLTSPIQRLIDKLSPSGSPLKPQPQSNSQFYSKLDDSHLPTSSKEAKRFYFSKAKPLTYLVAPFTIDFYCNYNLETSLHCAIKKRHYPIASLLLEAGANPNLAINGQLLSSHHHNSIITRVSHFNHNFFMPSLPSISSSMKEMRNLTTGNLESSNLEASQNSSSSSGSSLISDSSKGGGGDSKACERAESPRYRSTSLREAIRNRDKAMVELLLRFGARDSYDETNEENEEDYELSNEQSVSMNALAIAFGNSDFHFVSRLLSLKAFSDPECKINKKAFDIVGSNCMNAINRFNMVNNVTVSSMFPSKAVMIDWHQLGIKSLDASLQRHLLQWLVDSSLMFNVKLKLSQVQDMNSGWNTALAAITRIDLSNNALTTVPLCIFTDLPSLKILNLSKNRLQTLPELEVASSNSKDTFDDDAFSSSFRRNSGQLDSPNPYSSSPNKSKGSFFSRMRKSQSVTTALSSSPSARTARESYKRESSINKSRGSFDEQYSWNMPYLEELYLEDNQLECLPSSLFQQPELKQLDLSNNKLRTLPPLFWFSPKLAELNLSLNLLCDLPSPSSQCSVNCDLSSSFESLSGGSISNEPSSGNAGSGTSGKSIPKSISTSSISDNLKNISRNSFRFPNSDSVTKLDNLVTPNLAQFELNLSKPWMSRVNIQNETFSNMNEDTSGLANESIARKGDAQLLDNCSVSSFSVVGGGKQSCRLTQLNLSHNGFERVPFLLSCLATRLTHLNLSYNRLCSVFHSEYILGQYPLSLKHLDLSHNLIEEWTSSQSEDYIDNDEGTSRAQCCVHCSAGGSRHKANFGESKSCPYKQHTRLDHLKTLVLTNNRLKCIVVTRDELSDLSSSDRMTPNSKSATIGTVMSSSYSEQSKFLSRFSKKSIGANIFGSMDDLTLSETNSNLNLNSKASRYTRLFFPNLSMLDMANNSLVEVPKSISYLAQLSVLNLSGNLELTTLPPEMGLLTKLWNLNTRGCLNLSEPLRSMIISKTYKTCDIISYLNSILENSKPYTRMKLMIVGVQGIGKTSLLEQLRHEGTGRRTQRTPDHWGKRMGNKSMGMKTPKGVSLSTVGVDLYEWAYERRPLRGFRDRDRSLSRTRMPVFQAAPIQSKNAGSFDADTIGPITFRTWDFGGQREYYATHQYFLSKRSIYLVVWKITDGERGIDALHSWLLNIQSRAPNSPVIIVGTHYDLVKEYYPPFFSSDLQNMIRERYMADSVDADKRGLPRVVASVEVSAKTRHNVRLLANLIYETAFEMRTSGCKERLLEQKVPATYLALEEIISLLAYERKSAGLEPVLHGDQYRQDVVRALKERHNLSFRDFSELQQATRFLHENGVMLHYEDANLKDLYFLDPQWLCDILAHVVTIREINPFAKNGIMRTEHLLQLFKNSRTAPSDVQNYLLSLLNKFELALTWDSRTLLIPSLLPTEEQLQVGHPGSEILIPLRSRLKMRRSSTTESDSPKIEFKNQLNFQELNAKKHHSISKVAQNKESSELNSEPTCAVTAVARHNESIHRILLLSYVPCGFWSRLITRMVADESVIEIVRSFFHLPPTASDDPALIKLLNSAKAKWHCWQTGFGLRYLDTFLLRVKEFSLAHHSTATSPNSESVQANLINLRPNYPYDYQRIKFYLGSQQQQVDSQSNDSSIRSQWSEVHVAPQGNTLIEIYLPNQSLQVETREDIENGDANETRQMSYTLEPNMEMLTRLLVIIVEHIDTLLEDWYPSLGTRFIHTSDGRFLITRIVPCTLCMRCFVEETNSDSSYSRTDGKNGSKVSKPIILSPDTAEVDSNLVDFYKSEVKKATLQEAKQEFHDSAISTFKTYIGSSITSDSPVAATTVPLPLSLYHSVYAFMVEECILAVYEDRRLECPTHGRLRMEKLAPDVMFSDLKDHFCIDRDQLRFGKLLGRGSFGFVFRGFYNPKKVCHRKFDSPTNSTNANSFTKRSVSNSKFYLPHSPVSAVEEISFENFEVALKLLQPIRIEQWSNGIRKADMEAYSAMKSKWERDPLQYACKAYCTARTELNILASLKHSNIASIIGICPKPLALVLTLAPQGSLDTHIKSYRRSGVRIASHVLQQAFLQISKALEYLHQHHIIYRDLKSENVLVWSFPTALATSSYGPLAEIILKLADYGISRSSLPTGTKGFGGTEGFMAPEIMLHNGEEEYTEKVDCFSFAMFMYELCTLRFPFEGQEFAIRESILDGIRPSLTERDLQHLPEYFVDLMVRCWSQEPSERPTISQVVSIISAPEFCSLRDVTYFPENYALICATGFEKIADSEVNDSANQKPNEMNNFTICLSKVGKQIEFLESVNQKWSLVGHKLVCEHIANRTITAACVVKQRQLWLGDSQSRIHLYDLGTNGGEQFSSVCAIQLERENPASIVAIKSICWLSKANLVAICSTSGQLWLLSLSHLQLFLDNNSSGRSCFNSSELEMKEISNNGSMILCIAHVDRFLTVVENSVERKSTKSEHLIEIWCGQPEGKIAIVQVRPHDMFASNQIVVDHYDDDFVKQTLHAIYIGSNVALAERNDVFTLVASSTEPYIWSVLYTGFVIYQWDVAKRQILHRLDCSKLAPCSESLMSISIEDHLKPGSCQVTAIATNEDNGELYVGTNSGCIIVAESHSLKPVTVFRPYNHEVKFILTFSEQYFNNIDIEETFEEKQNEEKLSSQSVGRNALRSLHQVSTSLWPFNKRYSKEQTKDSNRRSATSESSQTTNSSLYSSSELKKRRPFVAIGRGYRNLLDRFIYTSANEYRSNELQAKQGGKLKDTNCLHALIWDSGNWNVE